MRFLMAAALLPAILLMNYIRRQDRIEEEPVDFLMTIAGCGAATVVSAMLLEAIGEWILKLFLPETSTLYQALFYFLVVAGAEELGKFVVLKLRTWHSPEFNYTFDAVVYATAASLGFAAVENVLYVFLNGGFGTAFLRALTAVPGHCIFGVFMGYHYGLAKKHAAWGKHKSAGCELCWSLLVPVLLHGFYDFSISMGGTLWTLIFFAFYLVILIAAFLMVRKLSNEDQML